MPSSTRPADSHHLIRVEGARENILQNFMPSLGGPDVDVPGELVAKASTLTGEHLSAFVAGRPKAARAH